MVTLHDKHLARTYNICIIYLKNMQVYCLVTVGVFVIWLKQQTISELPYLFFECANNDCKNIFLKYISVSIFNAVYLSRNAIPWDLLY